MEKVKEESKWSKYRSDLKRKEGGMRKRKRKSGGEGRIKTRHWGEELR